MLILGLINPDKPSDNLNNVSYSSSKHPNTLTTAYCHRQILIIRLTLTTAAISACIRVGSHHVLAQAISNDVLLTSITLFRNYQNVLYS